MVPDCIGHSQGAKHEAKAAEASGDEHDYGCSIAFNYKMNQRRGEEEKGGAHTGITVTVMQSHARYGSRFEEQSPGTDTAGQVI